MLFALALVSCILMQTAAQKKIPIAMVPDLENIDTCPSDQVRESTRGNFRSGILDLLLTPQCGDGIWERVAYLNMSDPSQQCPQTWGEYSNPARACGLPVTIGVGCESTVYSTGGRQYGKVCGRVIGYRIGTPDQFRSHGTITSADQNYVDGVSVTHGNPRNHIWTFAAGIRNQNDCPCSTRTSSQIQPSFVGNDYFCVPKSSTDIPLWDGQPCTTSLCCSFNSPPWFSVTLPTATSDDIEVRICGDEEPRGKDSENTPIGLLEIYVQ